MRHRSLGNTGLQVSEIGFGAWGIGGDAYGPILESDASEAVSAAFDAGINFYDTADLYGEGQSERVIGNTLKSKRSEVVIATKVGFLAHDGPQDYSPDHVERSLHESLERLQTDWLDVFFLHSPPEDVFNQHPTLLALLHDFKSQGLAKAFGISCRTPQIALDMAKAYEPDVLEINFNLIDQRALTTGMLDHCYDANIGVIARTPFAFGFLTGRYQPGVTFPPEDHRSNWHQEQLDTWARSPELFAELSDHSGRTRAELSLLFCTSHPAISSAIPGIMSVDEATQNAAVGSKTALTSSEVELAKKIYSENEFFVRPRENPYKDR